MTPLTDTTTHQTIDQAKQEWSNGEKLDQSTPPVARADEFVRSIGGLDLDTLRDHHLALGMAVIELAVAAGSGFPWSHDDPTVVLLRAAAKLSLTSPEATSAAAADLLAQLALR